MNNIRLLRLSLAAAALSASLTACNVMPQFEGLRQLTAKPAATETMAPIQERPETLVAVTEDNLLIRFNAATPGQLLSRQALQGLRPGEQVLGMDYRVARGELFALSSQGRLLRIDPATAVATSVGAPLALPAGSEFGVDFNPTVDRLRVVTDTGANLRLHPDTGAQVDGDPAAPGLQPDGSLAFMAGDLLAATRPRIVAAGYTYNKTNEKITTNYAIDAGTGYLVIQGSMEGATSPVSPNTGLLQAVGPLGVERFDRASFDIADVNNAAYLVTTRPGGAESRLYELNLGSGQARLIGAIAASTVRAMAIEP